MEKFLKYVGALAIAVAVIGLAFHGLQRHNHKAAYELYEGKWCRIGEKCVAVSHYLSTHDFDKEKDLHTVIVNFYPAKKWDALSQSDQDYVKDMISDDYHFTSGWKTDKVELSRGSWRDTGLASK